MRALLLLPITIATALVCQAQSATPPRFTLTDIGVLPGMTVSQAQVISPSGMVVGFSSQLGDYAATGGPIHGFIYKNGTLVDLGSASDYPTVLPLGVNDAGEVVGCELPADLTHSSPVAFQYANGTIQLAFGGQGIALAVNNAGQYVGLSAFDASKAILASTGPALLGTGETYSTLANPPGQQAGAFGISPQGLIAGATISKNSYYPVIWQSGVPTVISLPEPFALGWAWAINDSGQATGFIAEEITKSSAQLSAALFTNSSVTNIGALLPGESSMGTGINSSGWVIGIKVSSQITELASFLQPFDTSQTPFLYINGKVYDLNTLVDNASGWTLVYANGINDSGQIVGAGNLNGVQRAFLLTPEPAATPPPAPVISGVEGAGLSRPAVTAISPNGLFTVFGLNFAPAGTSREVGASDLVNNTVPTNLAQTCVAIGSTRAAITYVSAGQINAVATALPATGSVAVSVVTNCDTATEVSTAAVNVPVAPQAPEFLYFLTTQTGANPVAAIEAATGAYVGPTGLLAGAAFTPAKAGDVLTVFGIGFGATIPAITPGTLAAAAAPLNGSVDATIGGISSQVLYAGVSPGYAGFYQLNVIVPAGLAAGNQSIVITVNGVASPGSAYLAVQ